MGKGRTSSKVEYALEEWWRSGGGHSAPKAKKDFCFSNFMNAMGVR
jgi:hypothetical protein